MAIGPAVAVLNMDFLAAAVCLVTVAGPLTQAAISGFQAPLYCRANRSAGAT